MKQLLTVTLLGVSALGMTPTLAHGLPLEGKVSLQSLLLPMGYGGLAATPTSSLGVIAGLNQSWTEGRMHDPSLPLIDQGVRLVIGASYEHRWDRFRLRATPNLVTTANFSLAAPRVNWMDSFMSGPAWLELGYRFHPSWELSLRSSVIPLALSMLF